MGDYRGESAKFFFSILFMRLGDGDIPNSNELIAVADYSLIRKILSLNSNNKKKNKRGISTSENK